MSAHLIRPRLRAIDLGKLLALKREWGVSMQAIIEHAYCLRTLSKEKRTVLYKQLSRRGWRKQEPGSTELPPVTPTLASSIGERLSESGLSDDEVRSLVGLDRSRQSPFLPVSARSGLRLVTS